MSRPRESDVTAEEIPIVEAKLVHENKILGNSFAGILVPKDGKKRCRWMDIRLSNEGRIKSRSSVIASACQGYAEDSHLGDANYEIFNVVPTNGELWIRLLVNYGRDLNIRLHIIAYNPWKESDIKIERWSNENKKIREEVNFEEKGFSTVLTSNGQVRTGTFDINYLDDRINKYCKVVLSGCKLNNNEPELDVANVKVLNVVPQKGELLMRLYITGEPIEFRLHLQVMYWHIF